MLEGIFSLQLTAQKTVEAKIFVLGLRTRLGQCCVELNHGTDLRTLALLLLANTSTLTERFHLTSQRSYWFSKMMKRRLC